MVVDIPKYKLHNGNEIPVLGLGTWKSKPGEVKQAVKNAIDVGYRHIDCAYIYDNEKEVGDAIMEKISEGVVKREDLFITSKLWNNFHNPDRVELAIKMSLDDLRLDYLDLYLIHYPVGYKDGDNPSPKNPDGSIALSDIDYLETWKGMEGIYRKGLAKNIGVSNFNSQQIERLLKNSSVKPVVNQIECHPYLNQRKLSEFCRERGVLITAYSPLGSPDRPWAKPSDPKLLEDPKLVKLAKKHNKTTAQVLIRYQIDRGHVVIPKSVSKARMAENCDVFDFKLSPEDIAYIDSLDCNGRMCGIGGTESSPYYPFHIPF